MRLIGCVVATVAMITAGCTTGGHDQPDVRSQLRKTFGPQDVADYQHKYDDHLTECMRAAGFTYTPFHPKTPRERLGLTEREFAERYGFGISTLIDSEATTPQVDPNAAARAALPQDAQTRYDGALKSCADRTSRTLGPPPNVILVPNGKDDGYLDVSRKAEADPRVAEAKRAYAACMATNGITADSGEALQTDVTRRAAPFLHAYRQERERRQEQGLDPSGLRVNDALSPDQAAALARLQRSELRAAAADKTCGRQLYPVVEQVHAEYTRRYLDGQ